VVRERAEKVQMHENIPCRNKKVVAQMG